MIKVAVLVFVCFYVTNCFDMFENSSKNIGKLMHMCHIMFTIHIYNLYQAVIAQTTALSICDFRESAR